MKKIWKLLRIILTVVFFAGAVYYDSLVQESAGQVTVILRSEAVSPDRAKEICEQEADQEKPQSVCFWGEVPEAYLTCKETGKSSRAAAVLVNGNPEIVISGTGLLAYQNRGCFLDSDTAFELLGTGQAAGQIIWYNGCSYTVCGTLESLRGIMICWAEEGHSTGLDRLSLYVGKAAEREAAGKFTLWNHSGGLISSGRAETEQFLLRYGLNGEIIDGVFLQTLCSNLLLILPLIIGSKSFILLIRWSKNSRIRIGKILLMASAAAVAVMTGMLAAVHIQVSTDMIPSRWSDFSFWSAWWQRQRENLLMLLGTARGEAQLTMLWNLVLALLCNLCAVFWGSCI